VRGKWKDRRRVERSELERVGASWVSGWRGECARMDRLEEVDGMEKSRVRGGASASGGLEDRIAGLERKRRRGGRVGRSRVERSD
jgi:hypothetical protein